MQRLDPIASQEHWDSLADRYDADKQRNDTYYSALKSCFDRAIPRSARGHVLELGCGTGQVLASLQPKRGMGVDVSQQMINVAKRQFADRPELSFAATDATAAAGLGEFDAVISADVMEHVDQWKNLIKVIVQSCRPGGIIAISTPNPTWTFPLWILEKVHLKMPEGPHEFVRAGAIAQCLCEMNCEVVSESTHLLLPVHLGGVGPTLSRIAERMPILRRLGVIQLVVARRRQAHSSARGSS